MFTIGVRRAFSLFGLLLEAHSLLECLLWFDWNREREGES